MAVKLAEEGSKEVTRSGQKSAAGAFTFRMICRVEICRATAPDSVGCN